MGKFKSPKRKKSRLENWKGLVPCLVFVLSIFGFIMMLFYWGLKNQ